MTMRVEAQPRQQRRRRVIYPKRVELRMTEGQFDAAEEAAQRATTAIGRTVTLSDIIREAVDDGCRRLAREQSAPRRRAGVDAAAVDGLVDALEELRIEVRRIGLNVNQLARVAHQAGQVTGDLDDIKEQLAGIDGHVVSMEARLVGLDAED